MRNNHTHSWRKSQNQHQFHAVNFCKLAMILYFKIGLTNQLTAVIKLNLQPASCGIWLSYTTYSSFFILKGLIKVLKKYKQKTEWSPITISTIVIQSVHVVIHIKFFNFNILILLHNWKAFISKIIHTHTATHTVLHSTTFLHMFFNLTCFLNKSKGKYITQDACHNAVRALVLSRIDYANSLLHNARSLNLQNKAARLLFACGWDRRSVDLLATLH